MWEGGGAAEIASARPAQFLSRASNALLLHTPSSPRSPPAPLQARTTLRTMGAALAGFFIQPDELPGCDEDGCAAPFSSMEWFYGLMQVLTLMFIYGYVLFTASNMLSDGSELLLLVPSLAGVVGSVILPILGAVPDGAIMLFSGLGPDAQEQMAVGVGALAGSTIMLLTVPWSTAILAGRVAIGSDGEARYATKRGRSPSTAGQMIAKKLSGSEGSPFTSTGVSPGPTIRSNALLMVATSLTYLLIQGPAFAYSTTPPHEPDDPLDKKVSHIQHFWALGGFVLAVVAFCGYLVLMAKQGNEEEKQYLVDKVILHELENSDAYDLKGLVGPIIAEGKKKLLSARASGLAATLLDEDKKRLGQLINPFFKRYDIDQDGNISADELRMLLKDLHEPISAEEAKR